MIGAIIGDIIGSRFEFTDHSGKDFALFTSSCKITDDSLMTLAIAKAFILCKGDYTDLSRKTIDCMVEIGRAHPNVGWGAKFYKWIFEKPSPLNSFGNGAGMRVSPVGWVAENEDEVKKLSKIVTEVSHDHPEGLKGAESISMAIFWARTGKDKNFIRQGLIKYYPQLANKDFTIKSLIGNYGYDDNGDWVTCQGSIPQALIAFLDGEDFEDVIRNAVGIGGDSDTIGAMAGSIAEAYYGVSYEMEDKALEYVPDDLKSIYYAFNLIKKKRKNN